MKKMIALFTMLALSVSTFSFMLGASAADNAARERGSVSCAGVLL